MTTNAVGLSILIVTGLFESLSQGQEKPGKRPFTLDDLFSREEFYTAVSPDGEVVFCNATLSPAAEVKKHGYAFGLRMATPSLYFPRTGTRQPFWPEDIGNGSTSWSPDSRFFSIVDLGRGRFRVLVWDRTSGKTTAVTPWYADSAGIFRSVHWVSGDRLLIWIPPQPSEPNLPDFDSRVQAPVKAWLAFSAGKMPTASVLDSIPQEPQVERDRGSLLLIDLKSRTSKAVLNGGVADVAVSQDLGLAAARVVMKDFRPDPDRAVAGIRNDGTSRVLLLDWHNDRQVTAIDGPQHVVENTLTWSPDSTRVVFVDRSVYEKAAPDVYFYDVRTKTLVRSRLDPSVERIVGSDLKWVGSHSLLVRVESKRGQPKLWHLAGEDGFLSALPAATPLPPTIYPQTTAETFLYLAQGRVLRYDITTKSSNCLTCGQALVSSVSRVSGDALILTARENGATAFYGFAPPFQQLQALRVPADRGTAFFRFYNWRNGDALLGTHLGLTDTVLWTNVHQGGETVIAGPFNERLNNIDLGELRLVEYRSLDGKPLKGSLLLPFGYQSGHRYPLLTDVYPGDILQDVDQSQKNLSGFPNSDLLFAAKGYAVLKPSMPVPPRGVPNDNYLELTKGVLPAIDKVIEMGIADPDRLGVMGHSSGGFAVYGLITQTTRFKAAIAAAGISDSFSIWGSFAPAPRYEQHPYEFAYSIPITEGGALAMGAPPWQDPERYMRNSPLLYATRVETPLLILQGDMDPVPIQQGEEFFNAMYRLKKPARFVRYWGEGHIPTNPLNIRHMHEQMFEWLERYLAPKPGPDRTGVSAPAK
jgi:hypothetical protein